MDTFFTIYELIIEKFMHLLETLADAFYHVYMKIGLIAEKITNIIYQMYHDIAFSFYSLMRWTTAPYNYIIVTTWLWYIFNPLERQPYLMNVLKYWKGAPGAGKSLSSYVVAELIREETGIASYFTSKVEKPRLSEDGKYWYVYHRVIDLADYYQKGKKVKNFNTEKYATMFKDENNLRQNPRDNKKGSYNDEFKPEHDDEVLLRHLKFKHGMNVYSQQTKTDGQRMETTAYYFEIKKTVKGVSYKKWLHDGKFEIIPKRIKIDIYTLEVGWGEMKRHLYRRMTLKVPYELLEHFDTLAESNRFAGLPVDYK